MTAITKTSIVSRPRYSSLALISTAILMLLTLVATAQAQMPTPALPRVYINTTFNAPVGGQTGTRKPARP